MYQTVKRKFVTLVNFDSNSAISLHKIVASLLYGRGHFDELSFFVHAMERSSRLVVFRRESSPRTHVYL